MSNILIFKDDHLISLNIQTLSGAVPYFQKILDRLSDIGITAGLDEIVSLCRVPDGRKPGGIPSMLSHIVSPQPAPSYTPPAAVVAFVQDKYLEKAGSPSFGGVPIKQDKLKEMLSIPDLTALGKAVDGLVSYARGSSPFGLMKHMQISSGTVSLKPNASEQIEAAHSHYTKNAKGVAATSKINALIDALEAYENYEGIRIDREKLNDLKIAGITVNHDHRLIPNVQYVRRREG